MEAWHQKNLVGQDFPINLIITDIAEFPPHWHEELEIVYVLDEPLEVGLNHEIFTLKPRDILLIGRGEVHYFLNPPKKSNRAIIQFDPSLLGALAARISERKFITPLIRNNDKPEFPLHHALENQLLLILSEYRQRQEAYHLAIQARIYNLIVIILREIPVTTYSSLEQNKHLKRLERLETVFKYVEQNYTRELNLDEVAQIANFSVYHFTRFFKETTGMTFIQYLNNYRINKAIRFLTHSSDPITEIAFKSGFESIKTFNRVFKQIKGSSPTSYRKSML